MDKLILKGKRVLVSGGKGYLGSFLVKALTQLGAEVYTLSLNEIESERAFSVNLTDAQRTKDVVKMIQPDIIYHLAANIDRDRSFDNYKTMFSVNVEGTFNLLHSLRELEYTNFIFTSTSEVYGNNVSPFHEQQNLLPASPYSLTKAQSEHLIRTFSETYNKNYTILRLFNFYGKDMPEQFFIPQIIASLKRNEVFEMTKGEQKRDFLYVEDVVNALLLVAEDKNAFKEVFNVCSGKATQIKTLAEEIEKKMPGEGKVSLGAIPYRQNEIWEMIGSNLKIKEKLGFTVNTNLTKGIEHLIAQ